MMAKKKNGNGAAKSRTTALTIGNQEYAILKSGVEQLPEILKANLGSDGLNVSDLDRIKMPAGGGISWEVPTLTGLKTEQVIKGVIVFHKNVRAFWEKAFGDAPGEPPDCSSDDGIMGVGKPGGDCAKCLLVLQLLLVSSLSMRLLIN